MDDRSIKVLEGTLLKVLPQKVQFSQLFYERLFATAPELRPLFKGDIRRQQDKLMSALVQVVAAARAPKQLDALLANLGKRHVGYGVRPEHVSHFVNALLWTLAEAFPSEMTREVRWVWRSVLERVGNGIKVAMTQPSRKQAS